MESGIIRVWKPNRNSFNSGEYYLIELEPEKWLAWWRGKSDMPAMAIKEINARQFATKDEAERELRIIRMSHDFLLASVRSRVRF